MWNIRPVFSRQLAPLALAVALTLGLSGTSHAGVAWTYNMDSALQMSRTYNKPIMVDFYADWCGWCKKLDSDVYTQPAVQQESQNFVMLKMDVDGAGQRYAQTYQVQGLPTTLFLAPNGQVIGRIRGYTEARGFLQKMREVRSGGGSPEPQAAQQASSGQRPMAPQAAAPQPAAPSVPRPGFEVVKIESVARESVPSWAVPGKAGAGGASAPQAIGVYVLDEDGATRIDVQPKAAKPKKSGSVKAPAKTKAK